MAVTLEAARAQLYETARLWRDHPELREELPARIAAAKYLCTHAACQASETGLERRGRLQPHRGSRAGAAFSRRARRPVPAAAG